VVDTAKERTFPWSAPEGTEQLPRYSFSNSSACTESPAVGSRGQIARSSCFGASYAEYPWLIARTSDHNGEIPRFSGPPVTDPPDVRAKELT